MQDSRFRISDQRQTRQSSNESFSLAWAEMYIFVSALDQRFNFQFDGAEAQDFECDSDQLVVGTRGKGVLRARVTTHAFSG